jgi:FkbM family methyltransferase
VARNFQISNILRSLERVYTLERAVEKVKNAIFPKERSLLQMKLPFASFKRIGKYRIVNAELRWGIDLFDDLQRLTDPRAFQLVFDIGANVGEMSALFLKQFPRAAVHAFEPVGSTFKKLEMALGHRPRLVLHKMAASDTKGSATIRVFDRGAMNTLAGDLADSLRNKPSGLEKVEMCRLDDFVSEYKIDCVDLLKIDVEGFEAKVLHGCGETLKPERIRYIFFEFQRVSKIGKSASSVVSGHTQLDELDRLLETHGYRLLVIYTQGVHQNEPIGTYNALYGVF